jgi:hypothetical protein
MLLMVMLWIKWRLGGAIYGDQWNTQKGRAGRVLWLFQGFCVVTPA